MRPASYPQEKVFLAYSLGKDLTKSSLEKTLTSAYQIHFGKNPGVDEKRSWRRTEEEILTSIVEDNRLANHAFLFEYLPIDGRNHRVDMLILGSNNLGKLSCTVVEIKMWPKIVQFKKAEPIIKFGSDEYFHPAIQVQNYRFHMELTHKLFTKDGAEVYACSLLPLTKRGVGRNNAFLDFEYIDVPNFNSTTEMIDFHISHANNPFVISDLKNIAKQELYSSPQLAAFTGESTSNLELTEEQDNAYRAIIESSLKSKKNKKVIIVTGGPGTGKSVIGLKVFGDMIRKSNGAFRYLAHTANFRDYLKGLLYQNTLLLDSTPQKAYLRADTFVEHSYSIAEKGSSNRFELLVADEAQAIENRHRKGQMSNLGLIPPAIDIMLQARVAVFLLDPLQKTKSKMIGSKSYFEKCADILGIEVETFDLNKQFRCGENDDVVAFIDEMFNFREPEKCLFFSKKLDFSDFPFTIYSCIHELVKGIDSLPNKDTKAVISSFAWNWKSGHKDDTEVSDISINCSCGNIYDVSWNKENKYTLEPTLRNGYLHATQNNIHENSLSVHTTGGVEFDHVGVIIGNDISINSNNELTVIKKNHYDKGVTEQEILNNYRIISTRARKSLRFYCTDDNVRLHLQNLMKNRTTN